MKTKDFVAEMIHRKMEVDLGLSRKIADSIARTQTLKAIHEGAEIQ